MNFSALAAASVSLFASLVVSLSGVSSAQASDVVPVTSSANETFYGWENLGVSYVGVGIAAASWSRSSAATLSGIGLYALGSPITHAMNGDRGGRVAGSLVLDVMTPAILGFVGLNLDHGCSDDGPPCNHHYANALFLTGALVAPVIDAVLFGWKREEPKSFAVSPTVTIARKDDPTSATMFGLGGTF